MYWIQVNVIHIQWVSEMFNKSSVIDKPTEPYDDDATILKYRVLLLEFKTGISHCK